MMTTQIYKKKCKLFTFYMEVKIVESNILIQIAKKKTTAMNYEVLNRMIIIYFIYKKQK
jgi:hypothetical protein